MFKIEKANHTNCSYGKHKQRSEWHHSLIKVLTSKDTESTLYARTCSLLWHFPLSTAMMIKSQKLISISDPLLTFNKHEGSPWILCITFPIFSVQESLCVHCLPYHRPIFVFSSALVLCLTHFKCLICITSALSNTLWITNVQLQLFQMDRQQKEKLKQGRAKIFDP